MKILFLPKYYEEGASSRYRLFNYIPYFERRGHQVTVKPLLYNGYVKDLYAKIKIGSFKIIRDMLSRGFFLLKHRKDYDVIIIEKELFTNIPYFVEKILLSGTSFITDYDDAISINYKTNRIKKLFLGNKINKLCNNAILSTVGNMWYYDEIKSGTLQYLPTVIDLEQYRMAKKPQNTVPVIVWIGSPSTVKYLDTLSGVLKRLAMEVKFRLRIIGGVINLEGVDCEVVKWSQENEFNMLYSADIGIMPLYDSLWEKGKCGFKLIQYMAAGLPTLASPAPANNEITIEGETGYIAENETQWHDHLLNLLQSPELRHDLGRKARTRVEQHYSYQVWGDKFAELAELARK